MMFTPQERAFLAQIADLLIPAGDGFPAASAADVASLGLDSVLTVRPELATPVRRLLASCGTDAPERLLAQWTHLDADGFAALTELVAGAYFLNPTVRLQLGYGGQEARPIDPTPDHLDDGLLQSVLDRGRIYRPTPTEPADKVSSTAIDRYDVRQTYDWNFEHAPLTEPRIYPPVPGEWKYAGLSVPSPLAIAAGPLLNGRWVLHYASLGFDILTYKTVRSSARSSYPRPNLQPVSADVIGTSRSTTSASEEMLGSWAVSFGMPSQPPEFWQADIAQTRKSLARDKILAVSVVATPQENWTIDDVAADFARCAIWSINSGADCIEANFSCPNVSSADGQLYQRPELAARVAFEIRQAIGTRPLLLKIGHITDPSLAEELCQAVAPYVNGLVMVNCVPANVTDLHGAPLFNGEKRGIAGAAIRAAALAQIDLFHRIIARQALPLQLIGVGGIGTEQDVIAHLDSGCQAVQLATAAMLHPSLGIQLRRGLSEWVRRS